MTNIYNEIFMSGIVPSEPIWDSVMDQLGSVVGDLFSTHASQTILPLQTIRFNIFQAIKEYTYE
jgi:hypothetical protein